MNKLRIALFTGGLLFSFCDNAEGQVNINSLVEDFLRAGNKKDAAAIAKTALGNPETLNSVVGLLIDGNNNNFKVKFKTFQENNANAALGFDYSINVGKSTYNKAANEIDGWGFNGAFKATGNVAFDSRFNPADFLRSEFDMGTFVSLGGVSKPKGGKTSADFLNAVDDLLVQYEDLAALDSFVSTPMWKQTFEEMRLTNQYYVELSLAGGLESDQRFKKRQLTFGAVSNFGLKAWNKSNVAARLNVFDWPFAFIRAVTGTEKNISPRGSSLPTFMAGIDLVNPVNDSLRQTLTPSMSNFWRVRFEAGYRSLVTQLGGTDIYFNASYRWFKELNAPTEVAAAKKDIYQYLTTSLTSSQGFFISYSVGTLPFDKRDDAFYEIGFRYKFKD